MRRDPLSFFTQLAQEQGDIAQFRIGDHEHNLYLINHPDYLREVLVTQDRNFTKWFAVDRIREVLRQGLMVSEGEFHMRQRRLLQPAFHRDRIAACANDMTTLATRLAEKWKADEPIDICQEMYWLALMIIGRTMFGCDIESDTDDISSAMSELLAQFERSVLPAADRQDFESGVARLERVAWRIIKERRAEKTDRGDLLSMLFASSGADEMTDDQIRDEVMSIFLAGHESTSNALAWSWYLLAEHPDVETQLHAEIAEVLGSRSPKLDDLPRLELAGQIFAEAMRLYPPVWAIGRQAINDCVIGDGTIPAGSVIIMSQWVTHRDSRWFPEPEAFKPERWTNEARAARPKFSYFPFSAGSRSCVGEAFAGMEGVLTLAVIARKWRLRLAPGNRIALQPQLSLRARHGIKMQPEARG